MRINTRKFMNALLCCCFFVATGSADAANIRFFVKQSSGLYEIKGSTGGRFVVQPTGERISVRGVGLLQVRGYTDRVSHAEGFVVVAQGSGSGSLAVTFYNPNTRRTSNLFGPASIKLPDNSGILTLAGNSYQDGLTAVLRIGNQTISRRLPIGTR